jgi:predicted cobalt transporter CbtA
MLRNLLICGMLAGVVAGLLATGVAQFVGEPAINKAIALEEAAIPPGTPVEPELVSRDMQRSLGLLTAAVVYGLAMGGLFALVFAWAYGRVAKASPTQTALWLAGIGFLVVFLIPFLKYPANPPAVGDPETIGNRTLLFVVMIWISVFAAIGALRLRAGMLKRSSPATATVASVLSYVVIVAIAAVAMPGIQEVPADFPGDVLWSFRISSIGVQAVMWATIGIVFAYAAQRVMTGRSVLPTRRRRGEQREVAAAPQE